VTASPGQFHRSACSSGYQNTARSKAALELDVFTATGKGVWMQTRWPRSAMQRRAGLQQCATRSWSWILTSLVRICRSQRRAVFLDGPRRLHRQHPQFLQLRNSSSWCFRDRPARCVVAFGRMANVAPDNPIWIRFARAMDPHGSRCEDGGGTCRRSGTEKSADIRGKPRSLMASLSADAFRSA